jgi:hypothetical protein
MPNIPSQRYVSDRTAELEAAAANGDGAAAVAVLERIGRDGYPEYAEEVTAQIVAVGLRNLADGPVRR